MFLTKKSFKKILIMAICYFVLGTVCFTFAILFTNMGIDSTFLFALGIIVYVLNVFIIFFGRYAEGKGKLINLGNKLVRNELKPAEFIKHYELFKNTDDLLIKKPSIEILQLVMMAYDSLDDRENALLTVEEMIAVANEKKKAFVNLLKVSLLFVYDRTEEAELLFNEVQKQKLDAFSTSLVDAILKSDRAMVMGDYNIVETYNLKILERSFPKLDNRGKLVVHYRLGEVYEKLEKNSKAVTHYQYCADFGGETAIKTSAIEKINKIN